MAVTVLSTEIEVLQRFPVMVAGAIPANLLDFVFTAPSAFAEGISFPVTGRELILVQNTNAGGAETITIASVRDQYGRLGDVTTYSLPLSSFAVLPLGSKELFGAVGGTMTITMSAATVKIAVLQLPNLV